MKLKKIALSHSSIWLLAIALQSCGFFTTAGITLHPDIKTFSIQEFFSEVSDCVDLDAKFTEKLDRALLDKTNLTRVDSDGHIQYEGTIKSFTWSIQHADDGEKQLERLTIGVAVTFNNEKDEHSFQEFFSKYRDTECRSESEESKLVDEIIEDLIEAVTQKSLIKF